MEAVFQRFQLKVYLLFIVFTYSSIYLNISSLKSYRKYYKMQGPRQCNPNTRQTNKYCKLVVSRAGR